LEELLEECDVVESGIDIAEFDSVSVELNEEEGGDALQYVLAFVIDDWRTADSVHGVSRGPDEVLLPVSLCTSLCCRSLCLSVCFEFLLVHRISLGSHSLSLTLTHSHSLYPVSFLCSDDDRVMVWAGYMQQDLAPPPDAKASSTSAPTAEELQDLAIYRDNIAASNPESLAVTESSAARFFDGNSLSLKTTPTSSLTEWDLRASMETKKWFDEDYEAWQQHREQTIGQYPSFAADWRTDVRIQHSLDPAEVDYREWSMKEMWDLITQNGLAADPRDIPFQVRKPGSRTDFVKEGYAYHPSIPEWLDMQGKLMKDDDVGAGRPGKGDGAGLDEAALLASEFSDFDAEFDFSTNTEEDV
jgi:hypothetical protein